jgi:hypothetical protein
MAAGAAGQHLDPLHSRIKILIQRQRHQLPPVDGVPPTAPPFPAARGSP